MTDLYSQQLTDYLDGELTSPASARLEAHLETCPDCRDALAGLRRMRLAASALEDREPDQDLWPSLADRIRAEPVPATAARRRWLPVAAAAAAVLLIAVFWPRGTDPRRPTDAGAATASALAAEAWREDVARRALESELGPVVRDDLVTYERAVSEIRAALEDDPDDPYLRAHLTRTLNHQTRLLRRIDSALSEVL